MTPARTMGAWAAPQYIEASDARTIGVRPRAMSRTEGRTPPADRPGRNRATPRTLAASTARRPHVVDAVSFGVEPAREAVGHRRERAIRVTQRQDPLRPQRIELAPATASLRRRFTHPRSQQSLALQPVERRVDGADRHVASGTRVNLLADRRAVCAVVEPDTPSKRARPQTPAARLSSKTPRLISSTMWL